IRTYATGISKEVFYWRDKQSMFDFINIFTEYAQEQKHRERIRIEEKSGEMANWIFSVYSGEKIVSL
ncbi:hypothetical protein V7114_27290, partial [Neobacillus niacini]|uniref:hypothetical protein n=1 Tax=Neobacillus niacini TaxID=86668 RepID=UPI002FFF097E